jgi:hypothetical protein
MLSSICPCWIELAWARTVAMVLSKTRKYDADKINLSNLKL